VNASSQQFTCIQIYHFISFTSYHSNSTHLSLHTFIITGNPHSIKTPLIITHHQTQYLCLQGWEMFSSCIIVHFWGVHFCCTVVCYQEHNHIYAWGSVLEINIMIMINKLDVIGVDVIGVDYRSGYDITVISLYTFCSHSRYLFSLLTVYKYCISVVCTLPVCLRILTRSSSQF